MLVLSRKKGETVVIGRSIRITVLDISGSRIKLGFDGPPEVPIHREELLAEIMAESRRETETSGPTCPCMCG